MPNYKTIRNYISIFQMYNPVPYTCVSGWYCGIAVFIDQCTDYLYLWCKHVTLFIILQNCPH